MLGQHIYVNGDNARETIETALEHLEEKIKDEARSKAFKDCTEMWGKEIARIHDAGGPPRAQLSRILKMFSVPVKDDETI
jgi:hypothetical protein